MLRLKKERIKLRLTQMKLGSMTGIAAQDISALERGWRKPFPHWKEQLNKVFKLKNADDLFKEEIRESEDDE